MSIPPDNSSPRINGSPSPNAGESASNPSMERVSEVASSTNLSPPNSNASLQGRITPPMDRAAFEEGLNRWVAEGEPGENRAEAKNRILLAVNSTLLNLNDLGLKSLPSEIGEITSLTSIKLANNKLTSLPSWIGNLTSLGILFLNNNLLSSLPPEIGRLTSLRYLDLNYNELTELPSEIAGCRSIYRLDLAWNRLIAIPSEIAQLSNLEIFNLSRNRISSLPPEIGQLRSLKNFCLANTLALTGLPNEILNLPRNCLIDLTGCGLSPTVIDQLLELGWSPDYQGPRISYSIMEETFQENGNKSVEELMRDLYETISQPYRALNNIPGTVINEQTLQSWLSRLSYMNDYNNSPERKQWLVTNILKYLKLADEDPKFREQFAAIINDAAETCGDRVALSILHLGIAYKLATIDLRDMKTLADFLGKGVWAIEMLETCARQKIPMLRFFDEIEVYLGYPIMLKERLQLPIDVEGMLYFRCSALTPNDLDAAYDFVSGNLTNKEAYYNFLVNHDKWKEALALNHPSACAALERSKAQDTESAVTEDDYKAIEARYKAGLLDLTKKALTSKS